MGVFQQRINATGDNYYRWPGSGTWNQGLQLGNTTWGGHNGFLRWDNVTVPAGSTITSAYITLAIWYDSSSVTVKNLIKGIDEDDTAGYAGGDATGRATTTATVAWNPSSTWTDDVDQTSGDIKSIIQEIVDRAGWASGNAIGIRIDDNGSTVGNYYPFVSYTSAGTSYSQLTINYTGGSSPSASQSPSSSISLSPSPSPSLSPSASESPSPSPQIPFHGLKVAKQGKDAFSDNPGDLVFDSNYGTLKYFDKQTLQVSFDANAGDITGKATYTHNLGYYPFVEVFVKVNLGSGNYEYVPFWGAGASIIYSATYKNNRE